MQLFLMNRFGFTSKNAKIRKNLYLSLQFRFHELEKLLIHWVKVATSDCVGWARCSVSLFCRILLSHCPILLSVWFLFFFKIMCVCVCVQVVFCFVFSCQCVCARVFFAWNLYRTTKSAPHSAKESMHEWEWCNLYGSCLICEKPLMFSNISMHSERVNTHTHTRNKNWTKIFQSGLLLKGGVLW